MLALLGEHTSPHRSIRVVVTRHATSSLSFKSWRCFIAYQARLANVCQLTSEFRLPDTNQLFPDDLSVSSPLGLLRITRPRYTSVSPSPTTHNTALGRLFPQVRPVSHFQTNGILSRPCLSRTQPMTSSEVACSEDFRRGSGRLGFSNESKLPITKSQVRRCGWLRPLFLDDSGRKGLSTHDTALSTCRVRGRSGCYPSCSPGLSNPESYSTVSTITAPFTQD